MNIESTAGITLVSISFSVQASPICLQPTHLQPRPPPPPLNASSISFQTQHDPTSPNESPENARRQPPQPPPRDGVRDNHAPPPRLNRQPAPRLPLPPRPHAASPPAQQTRLAPLPPRLRADGPPHQGTPGARLHALPEAAGARVLPGQPGEAAVRPARRAGVLPLRGDGGLLQRARLPARAGDMLLVLRVPGAEAGGGGGGVRGVQGAGAAVACWCRSGGEGGQEVVQEVLAGRDDVCEWEDGLRTVAECSRCVPHCHGQSGENGIGMDGDWKYEKWEREQAKMTWNRDINRVED